MMFVWTEFLPIYDFHGGGWLYFMINWSCVDFWLKVEGLIGQVLLRLKEIRA